MDIVYWDSECQCELWRGTQQELEEIDLDIFGGGNYNLYPCPDGMKIVKVEGRHQTDNGKLRIVLEQE